MFDQAINGAYSQLIDGLKARRFVELYVRKLGKHGLRLSTKQKAALRKWIEAGAVGDGPRFQFRNAGNRRESVAPTSREIRRMVANIKKTAADTLPEVIANSLRKIAPSVLRDLQRAWPRECVTRHRELAGFLRRLRRTWRLPLDLLAIQLRLAREAAGEVNDELRADPQAHDPTVTEVMTQLHARACQIGNEVLLLLENGFAEGAMSRWRSLYEVNVVLQFIRQQGADVAERYLAHEVVEAFRGAEEYAKHSERLNYEAISPEETASLKKAFEEAQLKYGPKFAGPYGWAAAALGPKHATFGLIEEKAGFAHFRHFYRMASHPTHANPKGFTSRLGVMGNTLLLPTGPTNFGLADPGQNAVLSIAQATGVLLTMKPTPERILTMQVMQLVTQLAGSAFVAAQERIAIREERRRQTLEKRA